MKVLSHLDHSQNNHFHPLAPAAAVPVHRLCQFGVVLLVSAALLLFAGMSFFMVPALGIALHTVVSFWRHGMLGWIAFVSIKSLHLSDRLRC